MAEREAFFVGRPDPLVERAQRFVSTFWSDGGDDDEVRADLASSAAHVVTAGLAALRAVLDDPSKGWTLTYLVEIDANHSLDECTEAAARTFLEGCVALAEGVLESARRP
ncbi:hypothetical protein [Plantactinospora endophytica]|uniref:Uncharacterized protein n=1 Tax=Plantactinospora endophytica TaxID=673535 RepID=A0ABQ4DT39_9ACTN|nr:hypothetical protein [Plantactinospora endophytica]GIG85614.1 hypothetical protein Pen02_05500 [Plantactinospora endophytica]